MIRTVTQNGDNGQPQKAGPGQTMRVGSVGEATLQYKGIYVFMYLCMSVGDHVFIHVYIVSRSAEEPTEGRRLIMDEDIT